MYSVIGRKEERIATGVPGFDNLCEGGLVEDSLNLLLGTAGAGKTTFLLQFLYNGIKKHKQKGIYLSFEPEKRDLFRTAKKQGMDFESLDASGDVQIIRLDANTPMKDIQAKISKIIIKDDVRRVCIDPLNVYSVSLKKELGLRKQMYDFLSWLKGLNVCVLMAGESDEDNGGKYDMSEEIKFAKYSADAVIEMFSSGIGGEGDRAIRISKMRMTNHFRGPLPFEITDNGIKITSSPKKW
jgi:circadian clock protein KaiC